MPLYELIYLVNARATLPKVAKLMKRNAELVFENQGVVRRLSNMGIMPLAYPMYRHRMKHFKGRWVLMLFDGSPLAVNKLTSKLKNDQDVFRWGMYRQKDLFRPTFDENLIHGNEFIGEDAALLRQKDTFGNTKLGNFDLLNQEK
jgi:ribosomal protein S6